MTLRQGDTLQGLRIEHVLGEGRYAATDPVLDRPVVVREVAVDPELTPERLDAAAERLRKLTESHPALVRMRGLLRDDRPGGEGGEGGGGGGGGGGGAGRAYLVTERLEAKTVAGVIDEAAGPVQPVHVLKMLHAASVPLEAVHRRGVVHRALTPGKLLLPMLGGPDAKRGGVVLEDAGTVDLLAAGQPLADDAAPFTAPELFDPAAKVDGRADLYALGMIAYLLLAGRPAFEEAFKAMVRDRRNTAVQVDEVAPQRPARAPAAD